MFNSSLDGENLIVKHYYHIGFAADTPNGLVVPVIRDADKKTLLEIAREAGELRHEGARWQARAGRDAGRLFHDLQPRRHRRHGVHADHQRAGGRHPRRFARGPKPKWDGKRFAPRLMLPLSLSYDHRVVDGAAGDALLRTSDRCWPACTERCRARLRAAARSRRASARRASLRENRSSVDGLI